MNDDLIKRSDAIKDLCDISNNSDMPNDWHRGMSVAISALYRVPPVPPADRPQGEWIIEEFLWGGYVRMKKPKCSVCKIGIDHLATVLEDGSGWDMYKTADGSFRNLPRFCPNCGARMRK